MSRASLEAALTDLEDLARRGKAPSHHAARHVLLALGHALGAEASEGPHAAVERALAAGARLGPPWRAAVHEELSLACAEYARCLEPRYLSLPNYDLEYTLAARARLEDRLRASRALGFELPEREAGMLELADRVLASVRDRRSGRGSAPGRPRPDSG